MIWMELTRTDVVFSRTTMVLFLCRNKSSWNGMKLCEHFLYQIREFLEPGWTWGGHLGGHNPPGRASPPDTPRWVLPIWWPCWPPNRRYKIPYFQKKNQGGKIIVFHETEPPPSPVLPWEGISGVRLGLQRGGSSIFVITNTSPSPIPWCAPSGVSNSFVGSLVGEELDEIHHVIELVLLGHDL